MIIVNNGASPVTLALRDGTFYRIESGKNVTIPDAKSTMLDDSAFIVGLVNAGTLTLLQDNGSAWVGFPSSPVTSDAPTLDYVAVDQAGTLKNRRTLAPVSGGGSTATQAPTGAICVDSATGADTNTGTAAAPLRTLAAARALMTNGSVVALARGGRWREKLDVSALQNTQVVNYGSNLSPLPLLCGDGVAPPLMWSKTGGRTNVYQVTWPISIDNGYVNVWEDGVRLQHVADQATCDSTPGSFVNLGVLTNSTTQVTVYVHSTDDSNPASNGKVYEIAKLGTPYYGGTGARGNSVKGVWVRRPGNSDGGIRGDAVENCLVTEGSKHHIWVNAGGSAKRCVAYRTTNPAIGYVAGTMFICYTDGASLTDTYHEDCYGYGSGYQGFSVADGHTGVIGVKMTSLTYNGLYGYLADGLIAGQDVSTIYLTNAWAERMPTIGGGETVIADNVTWIPTSEDGGPAGGTPQGITATVGGVLSNLKAFITGALNNGVIKASSGAFRLTQSTIISSTSGYVMLAVAGADNMSAQIDRCVTYGVNRLADFSYANSDLVAGSDYNCFYKPSGNFDVTLKNTAYTSLAAYKAARPTLDQNSVNTDPQYVGNAKRGEFTLANTVTVAGQVAGAIKLQSRPDWAYLKNSWDQGFLAIDGIAAPLTRTTAAKGININAPGVVTATAYRYLAADDADYSKVFGRLGTAGTTASTVVLAINGVTVATVTFAANSVYGTVAYPSNAPFRVFSGNLVTATVTAAGTGAADLALGVA